MNRYINFKDMDAITKSFFVFLLVPYFTVLYMVIFGIYSGLAIAYDSLTDDQAVGIFGVIGGILLTCISLGAGFIASLGLKFFVEFSKKYSGSLYGKIALLCIIAIFVLVMSLLFVSIIGDQNG